MTAELDKIPVTLCDPIVFSSFYRPQIWGGRGLQTHLHRQLPGDGPIGEAWEISSQKLHVSLVSDGPLKGSRLSDLWRNHRHQLAGDINTPEFPLLIKWLECRQMLSVQVHPNDEIAQQVLGETNGKSEAWIVLHAERTARIYAGLKPGVTRCEFQSRIESGTVLECMHSFQPQPGDCVWLPAGSVHTAGGGLIFAEIQQSSDATFRLFDWNRKGFDGNPRPLQIEKGMEAINWRQGPISPVTPSQLDNSIHRSKCHSLVEDSSFHLERYFVDDKLRNPHEGQLSVWVVIEGCATLVGKGDSILRHANNGDTVLVPASAIDISWRTLEPSVPLKLLCVRLNNSVRYPRN